MMAWDWIMSIDTHWFSTLFGWYVFASMFVTALVVIFMVVTHLKQRGQLEYYNESHHHDLGKFIFAFSIFGLIYGLHNLCLYGIQIYRRSNLLYSSF